MCSGEVSQKSYLARAEADMLGTDQRQLLLRIIVELLVVKCYALGFADLRAEDHNTECLRIEQVHLSER